MDQKRNPSKQKWEVFSIQEKPRLQGVEIGEEIVKLLRGKRAAQGRHHPAALQDGLSNESVIGRQPAGEIFFPEQSLQARAIQRRGGICVVATSARKPVHLPPARLLGIQTELGIRFFRGILPATGQESQEKDARKNRRDASH